MKVKRFFAATMQEALKLVREEMGADAVILSNRKVDGGVEIVTALDYDESQVRQSLAARPKPETKVAVKEPTASELARMHAERHVRLHDEMERARQKIAQVKEKQPVERQKPKPDENRLQEKAAPQRSAGGSDALAEMRAEIHHLKDLLAQRLTKDNDSPGLSLVKQSLSDQLAGLGLERDITKSLLQAVDDRQDVKQAWQSCMQQLGHALSTEERELLDQGGVIALVGPTGSGKTTTIGKLAARYVLENDADSIALVTTDRYRIAAHEQLMVFGRILNVPVYVVDEDNSLDDVLNQLHDKHLVLIDTAGLNHQDPHWQEQLHEIKVSRARIRTYLVLAATNQRQILKSNYHHYKKVGLKGCIMTKVDEAVSLGEMLGFLIQSRLSVAYYTNGQKVPDDIHLATAGRLIEMAETLAQEYADQADFDVVL